MPYIRQLPLGGGSTQNGLGASALYMGIGGKGSRCFQIPK